MNSSDLIDIGLLLEFKTVGLDAIKNAEGLLGKFSGLVQGLAITGLTALSAWVGVATRSFIDQGEHLKTLSTQFGVTVPQLSAFEQGARLVGGSSDMVDQAFQRLSMRIGSMEVMFQRTHKLSPMLTADFNALGVKLVDHNGILRNMNDIMTDTVDKLAHMSDVAEMNRIAIRLLGGEGPQFIAMLKNSGESMAQLQQEATRLGATMSTQDANAADQLEMAHYRMSVMMQGLTNTIGRAMLPAMQALENFMMGPGIDAFRAVVTFIGSVVIPGFISLVEKGIKIVTPWFETGIPRAIGILKQAFFDVMNSGVADWFKTTLKTAIQDLPGLFQALADKSKVLADHMNILAPAAWAAAGAIVAFKLAVSANAIFTAISGLIAAVSGLGIVFGETAIGAALLDTALGTTAIGFAILELPIWLVVAAIVAVGAIIGVLAYLIITHWTQIKNFAVQVWNTVTTTIKNFATTVWTTLTGFVKTLGDVWKKFSSDPIYWIGFVVGWVIQTWSNFNENMKKKTAEILRGIGDWFSKLWPEHIEPWLLQVIPKAITWVLNLRSQLDTKFNELIKAIGDWFKNTDWAAIGRNIVTGIWNGVSGAAGWLKDQFSGFLHGLIEGAKAANQSHSPSLLWANEIGMPIAQGIAQGILNGHSTIKDALGVVRPGGSDFTVGVSGASLARIQSASSNDISAADKQLIDLLREQNGLLARIIANTQNIGPDIRTNIALAWAGGMHT